MDPKVEKARLLNVKPIEEEVLVEAQEILKMARTKVALGPSVITSIVVGLCHFAWTYEIDTLAVKLAGDGNAMLMVNPAFLIGLGKTIDANNQPVFSRDLAANKALFALTHEAYHLMLVHLYVDPALRRNPNWTTATEACINYRITKHLHLPLIAWVGDESKDKPGTWEDGCGVYPDSVFTRWQKAMKDANMASVLKKEDFFATDIGCFSYLESCPKHIPAQPRGQKGMGDCVHSKDDQQGEGEGQAPLDPNEVGKLMDRVLEGAIQAAKQGYGEGDDGSGAAKDEILSWVDSSPEASKMWGDLGAGTLRGDTSHSTKSDLWERWTADAIASRLADGTRWKYNKKLPWDRRVSASGREPRKHGSVFVDASGSMEQAFLDKVAFIISDIENIEIEWHSFDGEVWPFKAGEDMRGGGGTSFQIIDDHINGESPSYEGDDEHAEGDQDDDFVLVITDGYAPHIQPRESDKWLWLITPGGDGWPLDAGMSCREVDIDNE